MTTYFRFTLASDSELKEENHTNYKSCYLRQESTKNTSFILESPTKDSSDNNNTTSRPSPNLERQNSLPNNCSSTTNNHGDTSNYYYSINKPAHVYIDCCTTTSSSTTTPHYNFANKHEYCSNLSKSPFLFGGLEITSNARTVEAYITDVNGKENYLLTCRGAPLNNRRQTISGSTNNNHHHHHHQSSKRSNAVKGTTEWFICVIVHPSGPSEIQSLKLKLLSLQAPKDCGLVQGFKFKGKLPNNNLSIPMNNSSTPNTRSNNDDVDDDDDNNNNDTNNNHEQKETLVERTQTFPNQKLTSNSFLSTSATVTRQEKPRNIEGTTQIPSSSHINNNNNISLSSSSSLSNLSQSDIKAAMTTITLMSKSMEERIQTSMTKQLKHIKLTFTKQMQTLQHQNRVLMNMVEEQGRQINTLLLHIEKDQDNHGDCNESSIHNDEEEEQEEQEGKTVTKNEEEIVVQSENQLDDKSDDENVKDKSFDTIIESKLDKHFEIMKEFWREEKKEVLQFMMDCWKEDMTQQPLRNQENNNVKEHESNTNCKHEEGGQESEQINEVINTIPRDNDVDAANQKSNNNDNEDNSHPENDEQHHESKSHMKTENETKSKDFVPTNQSPDTCSLNEESKPETKCKNNNSNEPKSKKISNPDLELFSDFLDPFSNLPLMEVNATNDSTENNQGNNDTNDDDNSKPIYVMDLLDLDLD